MKTETLVKQALELIKKCAPYREFGESYRRAIDEKSAHIEKIINSGYIKHLELLTKQLQQMFDNELIIAQKRHTQNTRHVWRLT